MMLDVFLGVSLQLYFSSAEKDKSQNSRQGPELALQRHESYLSQSYRNNVQSLRNRLYC